MGWWGIAKQIEYSAPLLELIACKDKAFRMSFACGPSETSRCRTAALTPTAWVASWIGRNASTVQPPESFWMQPRAADLSALP